MKNLVALAPVLGAILRPVYFKKFKHFINDVKHSLMEGSVEIVVRNDQTYIHK